MSGHKYFYKNGTNCVINIIVPYSIHDLTKSALEDLNAEKQSYSEYVICLKQCGSMCGMCYFDSGQWKISLLLLLCLRTKKISCCLSRNFDHSGKLSDIKFHTNHVKTL